MHADSKVEVVVSNSGPGIPEQVIDEIFDTFYTTKPHGTGLGLSIARTIVETYGGKIWVENCSQGGAAFHFTIPLSTDMPAQPKAPVHTLGHDEPCRPPRRHGRSISESGKNRRSAEGLRPCARSGHCQLTGRAMGSPRRYAR